MPLVCILKLNNSDYQLNHYNKAALLCVASSELILILSLPQVGIAEDPSGTLKNL